MTQFTHFALVSAGPLCLLCLVLVLCHVSSRAFISLYGVSRDLTCSYFLIWSVTWRDVMQLCVLIALVGCCQ